MSGLRSLSVLAILAAWSVRPAAANELRGSRASLARQNAVADHYAIPRLQDLDHLEQLIRADTLVPIRDARAYYIDETLGEKDPDNAVSYSYARLPVRIFLDREAPPLLAGSGYRFKVTALARTKVYQKKLARGQYRHIAASGRTHERLSAHLTGLAVDISRKDMPDQVMVRLRRRLIELERQGLIEATEERPGFRKVRVGKGKKRRLKLVPRPSGNCFHIMVFPNYGAR